MSSLKSLTTRMLVSGAWFSKPDRSYYLNLVKIGLESRNAYTDEIEKDVRR